MTFDGQLAQLRGLWAANWPLDVPRAVEYPRGRIPLTEYLRIRARETPDRAAYIYYGARTTFDELDRASSRFAGYLLAHGLRRGTTVAVFMPNCPDAVVSFYGTLKAGCVYVPVTAMYKEYELEHVLVDSNVEAIVTTDTLLPVVDAVRSRTSLRMVLVSRLADQVPDEPTLPLHPSMLGGGPQRIGPDAVDLRDVLRIGSGKLYAPPVADLAALAALNYTGGTTGLPKGCEHSQAHMVDTGASIATFSGGYDSSEVSLVYVPTSWIAGEMGALILPVLLGTTCVLLARWDVETVMMAIQQYRVTTMSGTVPNYHEILAHPDVDSYDLSSLRMPLASSFVSELSVDLRHRWRKVAGPESCLREAAFGTTETHGPITFTRGLQEGDADLLARPIFCGLPAAGCEIVVADRDTGVPLPLGQEGEIVVRSPSLMRCYRGRPEATADAVREGWFYTGDIGALDEHGFLHFIGRAKEMLKVKGMSVFPLEIEMILGKNSRVESCAVVGIADREFGERPVAFVKLTGVSEPGEDGQLHAWCRTNMAPYKVPIIKIVDELPLTAAGKVRKDVLKATL